MTTEVAVEREQVSPTEWLLPTDAPVITDFHKR